MDNVCAGRIAHLNIDKIVATFIEWINLSCLNS